MSLSSQIIERLLFDTLERAIEKGTLHVTTPEGGTRTFKGSEAGSEGQWIIHQWQAIRLLASRGDIGLGEAYEAGLWDTPDLDALFCVFVDNLDKLDALAHGNCLSRFCFNMLNHVFRRNSVQGSSQNIQAHYDVGNEFYQLWLDPSMTYSSALYTETDTSLEAAQSSKYQRILDRIGKARTSILEVGCGWGGFAEQAANAGHHLTGLTISPKQHEFATNRLTGKRAEIRLQDYRKTGGVFDAIASIEMFEAVGKRYWPSYFDTIKQRMAPDGIAMVQTITVQDDAFDGYARRSDYIRHYVFPGGLLPSLATFRECAGKSGLACRDVFAFGQDYAKTLREWLVRFEAAEPAIRALGHRDAFIRSWRLYLSMCAASFACGRTDVMQLELVHA